MLYFCCSCYGTHRDPHSFPTRRSSDLSTHVASRAWHWTRGRGDHDADDLCRNVDSDLGGGCHAGVRRRTPAWHPPRSEEHTSELQSHSELVCRLLLEKKKANTTIAQTL